MPTGRPRTASDPIYTRQPWLSAARSRKKQDRNISLRRTGVLRARPGGLSDPKELLAGQLADDPLELQPQQVDEHR
jgi:hypothetical protein